jgi:hypothetical protein
LSRFSDRDRPQSTSLSGDGQQVSPKRVDGQTRQLRDPNPRGIEELENGAVPQVFGRNRGEGIEERHYLALGQSSGQAFGQAGAGDIGRWVLGEEVSANPILEETPHYRQFARD